MTQLVRAAEPQLTGSDQETEGGQLPCGPPPPPRQGIPWQIAKGAAVLNTNPQEPTVGGRHCPTLNPQPWEGEALLLALPCADLKVEEACRAITAPLSWGMDGHSFVTFPTPTWQTAMLQGPSASEPLLHCSCP